MIEWLDIGISGKEASMASKHKRPARPSRTPTSLPRRESASSHVDGPRARRIRRPSPQSAAADAMCKHKSRKKRRRALLGYALLALLLVIAMGAILVSSLSRVLPRPSQGDTVTTSTPDDTPSTDPLSSDAPAITPLPSRTMICIDPGHGYADPGTSSEFLLPLYEKDINLSIALKLRDMLISDGYEVILTRDGDTPPTVRPWGDVFTPQDRVDYLRKLSDVDYFISLHCNAYDTDPAANGAQIYYYTENSDQTPALAQSIADAIHGKLPDQSPSLFAYRSTQAFAVTKHSICPALLIEMGFVTNRGDAVRLADPSWQSLLARGIANGLEEHIRLRSTSATEQD